MPELNTSSLFGKYAVGKLLGCGAFAKVYHARHLTTGQSVAIKIINKNRISHNSHLIANIITEINITHTLHHPHIVKLHEVMATKTKIYFVIEFVKGGELFTTVQNGKLTETVSRKLFQQLISAIGYCHSHGVYHRDLKLENLLIDENGDLKVSDFGLSAVRSQIRSDGLLHTLCGTPSYVAPEILTKRGYDGAAADVWSCGVILFVMCAGYLPFSDANLMMMYKKVCEGTYRCPKLMSPELRRLLSRLLETDPVKRITVDEIFIDPWFRIGYKEVNVDLETVMKPLEVVKSTELNAFDIISFSSGLDLTALFESGSCLPAMERVVVAESVESVIGRVEESVREEDVMVRRRGEGAVDLVRRKGGGVIRIEVLRLSDGLTVVEVRCGGGEGGREFYDVLWKGKIRAELVGRRDVESCR